MSGRGRQVWLAVAAATAVLVGHVLDAFGLLPGVAESAAVRAAVLAPKYDVLTVVGSVVLALGADRLIRLRRPVLALVTLIAGQLALLGAPEVLGHEAAGEGEEWGALTVAVGLQVLLATAAVVTVLLVEALLAWALRRPAVLRLSPFPRPRAHPSRVVVMRGPLATRMRGPPVPVVP
jgi:hypothetical protein